MSLYEALGSDAGVRRLVDAFYDVMDRDPTFAHLRALHPDLPRAHDRLFKYLTGWTGGPPLFTQEFGHPMLRARHLQVAIDQRGRDAWLACMRQALDATVEHVEAREALYAALAPLADHMRNQPEPG